MELSKKIEILSAGAKYDASCASSGSSIKRDSRFGSCSNSGICHSWTNDGRCVSLLKILLSNECIYDCAYCLNRRSNDIPRATFLTHEIVHLTTEFYRRNYIEGVFLSSGVFISPDVTMEAMIAVAKELRLNKEFGGYIHLKVIPGASQTLIDQAGFYADRVSINIELPSEESLKKLAPQKNKEKILIPMENISKRIAFTKNERRKNKKAPVFSPAGQSTQLIVGASPEPDLKILKLSQSLYNKFSLKRIYYSAYVPVNRNAALLCPEKPPLLREHRLYQADWLLRFYGFDSSEILDEKNPNLEEKLDPKTAWALRNPHFFPVEVSSAPYEVLLRVPGIGVLSAKRICAARKFSPLTIESLKKIGVVWKRTKYFITVNGKHPIRPGFEISPTMAEILCEDTSEEGLPLLFNSQPIAV